jgi:hypothetical protein
VDVLYWRESYEKQEIFIRKKGRWLTHSCCQRTSFWKDRSLTKHPARLVTRDTLNIGENLMQNRRCFIRKNETIDTLNYYLRNMGLAGRFCRQRMGSSSEPSGLPELVSYTARLLFFLFNLSKGRWYLSLDYIE